MSRMFLFGCVAASSMGFAHLACAAPSTWVGSATVTFSNQSQNCTGLAAQSNNGSIAGSVTGASQSVAVFIGHKSTGFPYVAFDFPYVTSINTTGPSYEASSVYNRRWVVSFTGSANTAGFFAPGIAPSNITANNNLYFSGNDLNGSISVSYTGNGTSCSFSANIVGVDAGP